MPQQFENPANIAVHVRTTAQEILADFPDGLDAMITGVGTGGHLTGCAQVLKAAWPALKVFAVEPSASPVISGGAPSPHPIQGIGAGFIPANLHTALQLLCEGSGLTVRNLAPRYDVDVPADLTRLCGDLATDARPARRALYRALCSLGYCTP